MLAAIKTLPEHVVQTLTWDQGTELAQHRQITLATTIAIDFCDPHSPCQRGTNENTNWLLRQYFPTGTDLPSIRPSGYSKSLPNSKADPAKHSMAAHPLKPSNDHCQSQKSPSLRRPVEFAGPLRDA